MSERRRAEIWLRISEASDGTKVALSHVCTVAVSLAGLDGAAVTLVSASGLRQTVETCGSRALDLEETQTLVGEGPGPEAFADGGPVLVNDIFTLASRSRWPAFAEAAGVEGIGAVYAFPLQVGAIRLGTLTLHRVEPGRLTELQLGDALLCADAATTLLLDAASILNPDVEDRGWPLDEPAAHQEHVHQATGMVIVQLGVTAEVAFARLRAHAFALEMRLEDVAEDVVQRRLRFAPDPTISSD